MLSRLYSVLRALAAGRYVGGVAGDEAGEGGDAHQQVFEDYETKQGAGYAEQYVDNVVMGGVNGGKPYAEGDYRQDDAHPHWCA